MNRQHPPERENTCAFSGHRPEKLPWRDNENAADCLSLKQTIADTIRAVYNSGIRHFMCGMAIGCDTYFCEAVINLREEYPEITIEAAIPYEKQASAWREADRLRYNRLCAQCDMLTIVRPDYSPECMARRNKYMVDNSRILIAAYNGSKGGTRNTMLYAMRRGVEIIEIKIG